MQDFITKINTPEILNTRFIQLLNSLSGIRAISNLGNQQIDKEQFIDSMMQAIIEHMDAETVSFYFLEEKSLECVAQLNWQQYINNESSINNEKHAYSFSEGIIGKTATNCQVIHIQNCNVSDDKQIRYETNEHEIGSLICAPVMTNNTLIGIIELSHPYENHFESWQEKSILIYADLIGMLLNNIKLMTNMQSIVDARTSELQLAFEKSDKLRERYEEMSVIDHLTKLYNRRYFFTEVTSCLARAKRYSQSFTIVLLDLDHFKKVNDTFGHECGDDVLISISEVLNKFIREGDTLARIGGEEFVLALPEINNEGTIKLAERIRKTIENMYCECKGRQIKISVSIGFASLNDCRQDEIPEDDIQVSDILRKADLALYYVKQNGRNGVKAFSEIP